MGIKDQIFTWVRKRKPLTVCVEAAHIYMDETLGAHHLEAARMGNDIAEELTERANLSVSKVLFIDDYNPNPDSWVLDVDEYVSSISEVGFVPNLIVKESSLEIPAMVLFSKAEFENSLVRENNHIYLERKQVCLTKDGRPVCNLLDAALYVAKMSMFDLVITILPRSFKSQQKNTRKILKTIGYKELPVFNIYY